MGILIICNRRVKGRLNLCSHSLIFDPEDIKLPIIKLPFKYVDYIRQYIGNLTQLSPDIFTVKSQLTIRMRENNLNAPYTFKEVSSFFRFHFKNLMLRKETEEHTISLNYVSLSTFLPKLLNLFALSEKPQSKIFLSVRPISGVKINKKTIVAAELELKGIIDERESTTPFDTSALVDLNEKILKETTGNQ